MPPRRTRTGCLTCRQRRVKCDETYPRCRRCVQSDRECRRGLFIKFVHGVRLARESIQDDWNGTADYSFEPDQPWLDVESRQLSFLDESQIIASEYLASPPYGIASVSSHTNDAEALRTPQAVQYRDDIRNQSELVVQTGDPNEPQTASLQGDSGSSFLTGYESRRVNGHEALVLRHYISHLGPSLDVCDPNRQFSTGIVELAMTGSDLVFNAVMAASAHHLGHTNGSQCSTAELYHARCIELLIPRLDESPAIQDEIIAAVVLLRFYEQMASAVTGSDSEAHLTGASAFMNSGNYLLVENPIRNAAFWLFLRQDIDIAISQQRCLTLRLDDIRAVDADKAPRSDWEWANRTVWIVAQATNHLFEIDRVHATFEYIRRQLQDWVNGKPASFRPLHVVRGQLFDEIYFTQTWHALALQYYHTAEILLLLSDDQYKRVGVGSRQKWQSLQRKIMEHATQLFSISSSGDGMQARLGACHVVSVIAPYILDEAYRHEIIRMLRRLEQRHAWPTRAIGLDAMREWDWDAEYQLQWFQTEVK